MTKALDDNDKGIARRDELRRLAFALNDALYARVKGLVQAEKKIINLLVGKKISLNPKLVSAHMLANRTPVKTLHLDIRMHQRNILYFKSRRRSLENELNTLGISLADLDAEWEKSIRAKLARPTPSQERERTIPQNEDSKEPQEKTDSGLLAS